MTIINQLASIGMAVGPPLVYVDQLLSIVRRRDSTGFSMDVCGVLITANIIRVFFWFGKRFETALLVQSLLCVVLSVSMRSRSPPRQDDRISAGAAIRMPQVQECGRRCSRQCEQKRGQYRNTSPWCVARLYDDHIADASLRYQAGFHRA